MSDDVLSVVPTDPYWQPEPSAADRAGTLVTALTGGQAAPETDGLGDEELAAVGEVLGHPVRQIRAHI